jgi:hypothetical protein
MVSTNFMSDEIAKAYRALGAQDVQPGDFVQAFYDPVSETVKQSVIKPGGGLTEKDWASIHSKFLPTMQTTGWVSEAAKLMAPGTGSATPEPMIDWQKVAGSYAAALAEANSKVADLERACDVYRDMVADFEAKSAPPAPPSRGQQIANALRFDPLPGSYAR